MSALGKRLCVNTHTLFSQADRVSPISRSCLLSLAAIVPSNFYSPQSTHFVFPKCHLLHQSKKGGYKSESVIPGVMRDYCSKGDLEWILYPNSVLYLVKPRIGGFLGIWELLEYSSGLKIEISRSNRFKPCITYLVLQASTPRVFYIYPI